MHRATLAQFEALDRLTGSLPNAEYNHRLMTGGCIYLSLKIPHILRYRYLIRSDGKIEQLPTKTVGRAPASRGQVTSAPPAARGQALGRGTIETIKILEVNNGIKAIMERP
jgi:hypothetical protein